jgi:hypothetical protein
MDYETAWNYYTATTNVFDKNQSISVPANDAFVMPDGSIELMKAWGGFLGYQHYWDAHWRTNVWGSYLNIRNPEAAQLLSAGTDNAVLWDVGLTQFWSPVKGLDLGAEVVYTNLRLSGAQPLATATSCPNSTAKCPVPATSDDIRARVRVQYSF